MKPAFRVVLVVSFLTLGCGKNAEDVSPTDTTISEASRLAAASSTATENSFCTSIHPFYWEIGSSSQVLGSGTVGGALPTATDSLPVASASKWLFSAYVIEKKNGVLDADDINLLRFTSGYSTFTSCIGYLTVGGCYNGVTAYSASDLSKFYYSGGHFQKYASVNLGLNTLTASTLSSEINSLIGSDVNVAFSIPQPAGAANLTPNAYGIFLRKILNSQLQIKSFLGTNQVCTNTASCSSSSNYTPIPSTESWSYSLGHWVENDPIKGDGAFSSPGLYGFYPWINSDKTRYGMVARYNTGGGAYWDSVLCGRLIRKAYATGVKQ